MSKPVASQDASSPLQIPAELLIEGVALGIERGLASNPALVDRLADVICSRFELLTPEQAAGMIDVTTRTLSDNHVQWGLDKSVAFGATNPRYFLSQILEIAKARKVNGKKSSPQFKSLEAA